MKSRSLFCVAVCLLSLIATKRTSAQDAVSGPMVIALDDKDAFWAFGSLTTVDNVISAPAIDGPFLPVPGLVPNWSFQIKHRVTSWVIPPPPPGGRAGANSAQVGIQGTHIDGPHPGPGDASVDVDPNALALKMSPAVHIPFFGPAVVLTATEVVKHPTVAHGDHFDHYSLRSRVTALGLAVRPPAPMVTGPAEIKAKHSKKSKNSVPHSLTVGSSHLQGSRVSYDAGTGQLTFTIGPLDILNAFGSLAPGIDTAYTGDPILTAQLSCNTLAYQGMDPDGRHRFSGGHAGLVTPNGDASLNASFDEYLIEATHRPDTLKAFGLFSEITTVQVENNCISDFFRDFVDANIMGTTISSQEWKSIQGVDFTFVTPINFVSSTNGFTQSIFNEPATFVICANNLDQLQSAVDDHPTPASGFRLHPAIPNPFGPTTTILYDLPEAAEVTLEIFDIGGRLVSRLLESRMMPAGKHSIPWRGTDDTGQKMASGVYFIRLQAGSHFENQQMALVR